MKRKSLLLVVFAFLVIMGSLSAFAHFPTPADCATGNFNGVTMDGPPGRGAICVGAMGHNIVYLGGNANTPCGTVIVADQVVSGSGDPNDCA